VLVTLTGENAFGRSAELKKLVSDFVAEYSDMALERLDGEEVEYKKIYEAFTSLPFLASKKLVMLRSPSANKEFSEKAEDLFKNLSKTTDVILVEPKLDKRSIYFKLLKKSTDFREFNELDENSLARWLNDQTKTRGGNISPADARFLVERVGPNQQLLAGELDKLLLYDPNITRTNIELLSEPTIQSSIFELLDTAFAGNRQKAMELYDEQRRMKIEPQQIIAMLAWQFHVLALVKTAGEQSAEQIASKAKLNPFVVRKSLNIARRLTLPELKKQVSDLLTLDVRLKSESINPDEALRYFLLNLVN
jgi:DNA polymerase-3 subunit delta